MSRYTAMVKGSELLLYHWLHAANSWQTTAAVAEGLEVAPRTAARKLARMQTYGYVRRREQYRGRHGNVVTWRAVPLRELPPPDQQPPPPSAQKRQPLGSCTTCGAQLDRRLTYCRWCG